MARQRLTLDLKGMKNPLDVGGDASAPTAQPPESSARATPPADGAETGVSQEIAAATVVSAPDARPTPRPTADTTAAVASGPRKDTGPAAAAAHGYAVQTAIYFDVALFEALTNLAGSAGVSLTSLLVATLTDALPEHSQQAGETALLERLDQSEAIRIQRNVRLPQSLRTQLDELSSPNERIVPGARSLLINAVLRAQLPSTVEEASEIVRSHARRQAFSALRASQEV